MSQFDIQTLMMGRTGKEELARERFGRTPAHFAADPVIARARRAYFQRNYPIHWGRVEGVAAGFGLDPDDDRYDLSGLGFNLDLPVPPMGCSVVYYPPAATGSGSGYLSRNYDFSTGSLADIMQIPLPPEVKRQLPPVMCSPYVMEWYPEDGGYASLAIQAFDALSGTLDGINSAGLVVSILADEEAIAELVLIEFWATWCPPCRSSIPGIERLHRTYGGKGLVVLAISMDEGGWDKVKAFTAEHGITYSVLQGNDDVSTKYLVRMIPAVFLVDKQGNIAKQFIGGGSDEDMEKEIKALL